MERKDEAQHVADGDELHDETERRDRDLPMQLQPENDGEHRVEHDERGGDREIAGREFDRAHAGASFPAVSL